MLHDRVMVQSSAIVKPIESLLLILTWNILPSFGHTALFELVVTVCDEMFKRTPGVTGHFYGILKRRKLSDNQDLVFVSSETCEIINTKK